MSVLYTCHELVEILSDFIEGRLRLGERLRLRLHLLMCPVCMGYFKQFKRVHEACGKVLPEDLPEDFEEVMGRALEEWKRS